MSVKPLSKLSYLTAALRPRFFGFFQGHAALKQDELDAIHHLVEKDADSVLERKFEDNFARLTGGEAVSFAACRMAFYAVLQALGIGKGDEVLLTGFTCSVMPNAVWRTGATPRYADISADTLGTDPAAVARKITNKTRAIVLQHTFGLPCDVEAIAKIAQTTGIPLIEDCALTVGSSMNGQPVGSWGEAAIFSTDHSKPLNTITGGLLVTQNRSLVNRVREIQTAALSLPVEQRRRLWKRLLLERRNLSPGNYGRGRLAIKAVGGLRKVRQRFNKREEFTLLEGDFKPRIKPDSYPYPARMPVFLAQVGLSQLAQWQETAAHRRSVLARLFEIASPELKKHFPAAYRDAKYDVVPLRLAYSHPRAHEIEQRMRKYVDTDYIWFREPIVCATAGPASFGYVTGDCPVAEHIGQNIINWPCDVPEKDVPALLKLFSECHRNL